MVVHTETFVELVRSSTGTAVLDGVRWPAADLIAGARRAAGGLRSRLVQRGDGVLLVDDGDGADILAAVLGSWWIGARVSVVPGTADDAHIAASTAQTGAALVVRQNADSHDRATTFTGLLTGPAADQGTEVCTPDDIALDVLSSGTTGRPKCVSYTHRALTDNIRAYAERLDLDAHDVLYSPLPLSLAGVLGMVVLPGLLAGATAHVGRLSGPRVALAPRQIHDARPTMIYGVPYTFDLLARQRGPRPGDQLRSAICSSAPLPEGTFNRVTDYLGVPPRSAYCLAEAAVVALNSSDDLDSLRHSVGEPLDGVEVMVEPTGSGDRAGRLVIGGTGCGAGYRRDGVLEAFPGGCVRTNDLGFFESGSLRIAGRTDEVIQVAGQNVDLAYIRQVVSRCPGLGDFAVVIDRHEHLGTVPILLAEAGSLTITPGDVIAFCRRELRDIEVPQEVRVVQQIPRTATGKVPLAGRATP